MYESESDATTERRAAAATVRTQLQELRGVMAERKRELLPTLSAYEPRDLPEVVGEINARIEQAEQILDGLFDDL